MADAVEIKIENARDLITDLRAFSEDVAVRTVKKSVARIGKYVLVRLRSVVPIFTGRLAFNLGVRAKYVKSRGIVAAKVFVNTKGKPDDPKNAFYWRFVEFDRKTRPRKRQDAGAVSSGKGSKRRRRVWDRTAQSVIPGRGFITGLAAGIQGTVAQMFFKDLQAAIDRAKKRSR